MMVLRAVSDIRSMPHAQESYLKLWLLLGDKPGDDREVDDIVQALRWAYKKHKSGFPEFTGIGRVIARKCLRADVGGLASFLGGLGPAEYAREAVFYWFSVRKRNTGCCPSLVS